MLGGKTVMSNEGNITYEDIEGEQFQRHQFYQYEIETEDDLANLYLELYQDYPLYMQEAGRLGEIIRLFKSRQFTIVAEEDYVDKQYRDSYYTYFSQKYDEYVRNGVRLAFFEGHITSEQFFDYNFDLQNILIGTLVLRPLKVGNIGQTLLNPKKINVEGYYRTCSFKVMIYGRKLRVNAFPYSSQDNETMTCAETALFNLIDYYGNKYSEYRILMPSEILQDIEQEAYERVLPSQGLSPDNMAKVLEDSNFYPQIYSYEDFDKSFDSLLYVYVESGIPLILSLPTHFVVCVGHGKIQQILKKAEWEAITYSITLEETKYYLLSTADLCHEYIVMDDNKAPYYKTEIDNIVKEYTTEEEKESALEEIKKNGVSLIVPLYRRIFMDAARADSIFKSLFWENKFFLADIRKAYDDMTWGTEEKNPFVWRMYLTAARSYKDFKTKTTRNKVMKYFYMDCALPRFIWVLEIGTIEDYVNSKARVEILLDATSSPHSDTRGILSIAYKNHFVFVPDELYDNIDIIQFEVDDTNKITMESFKKQFDYNFTLTKVFELLYDYKYEYVDDTFEIFEDSNLEGNF